MRRRYCLRHLVPFDQSIEWSGLMMPMELNVGPALMVVSLVSVAVEISPWSLLI
jgi:hypothetical protein